MSRTRKRQQRESPPPSRWGRSKTGKVPFYLIHSTKRDHRGRKLYRCDYGRGIKGRYWTLEELEEAGVRWLKRKPKDWPYEV